MEAVGEKLVYNTVNQLTEAHVLTQVSNTEFTWAEIRSIYFYKPYEAIKAH